MPFFFLSETLSKRSWLWKSSDSWVICSWVRTCPGTAQGCLRCDSEIQPEPIGNKARSHRLISLQCKQSQACWQLRLSSVTPRWLPESACQTRFILLYVKLLAKKEEPDGCYCPLVVGSSLIFIQSEWAQHWVIKPDHDFTAVKTSNCMPFYFIVPDHQRLLK